MKRKKRWVKNIKRNRMHKKNKRIGAVGELSLNCNGKIFKESQLHWFINHQKSNK